MWFANLPRRVGKNRGAEGRRTNLEVEHSPQHFPVSAEFTYGQVPENFIQRVPAGKTLPAQLDPGATYTIVVERCMGGPQTFSLKRLALTEYGSN